MGSSAEEKMLELYYQINRDAAIEMSYKPRQPYIARCKELKIDPPKVFYDPKIRSLHPWLARRPRSIARFSTLLALDAKTSIFRLEEILRKVEIGYPPLISYTNPEPLNKDLVLCDPMAGGGSIPLESILLGIKTIAFDYNPVSYLVLKGCIEYPLKFKKELSEAVKKEARRMIEYAQAVLGRFYRKQDDAYIFTKSINCPSCKRDLFLTLKARIEKKEGIIIKKSAHSLKIRCSSCGNIFEVNKQEFYSNWVNSQKKLTSSFFSGEVDYDLLINTHPISTKKTTDRRYVVGDESDHKLLMDAYEFLTKNIDKIKEYIPMDRIHEQNKVFAPLLNHGLEYWYQIFNPRQLLALATLTRYVRKRSQELISKEGEFGVAVSLYLCFGLSKMVDFNTILTTWNVTNKSIRDTVGQYARSRKVELNTEYCEAIIPYKNLPWVFEPNTTTRTGGGICPVVEELCKQMEGLDKNIKVFQFDAKKISLLKDEIDLINVDPPYFDQHIYSDLSEFFWMVARNCLKDLIGRYLFNEEVNERKSWEYIDWDPHLPFVPRKDELIVRKRNDDKEIEKYRKNMTEFFKNAYNALKDDGKLILWFTHKSWKAWESILHSLYISGFKVTGFYPFVSEHPTRSVSMQGEPKLNRTIVIIASKYIDNVKDVEKDIIVFCSHVYKYLDHAKIMQREEIQLWEKALTLMAAATARLTIFEHENKEFAFKNEILPKGIALGLIALLKILGTENGKDIPLDGLDDADKADLLLHTMYKLLGRVEIDLANYICKYYNTSTKYISNGRIKLTNPNKKVASMLEAIV